MGRATSAASSGHCLLNPACTEGIHGNPFKGVSLASTPLLTAVERSSDIRVQNPTLHLTAFEPASIRGSVGRFHHLYVPSYSAVFSSIPTSSCLAFSLDRVKSGCCSITIFPLRSLTEAGKGDKLRLGERKIQGEDLRTTRGVLRNRRRQHFPGERRRGELASELQSSFVAVVSCPSKVTLEAKPLPCDRDAFVTFVCFAP